MDLILVNRKRVLPGLTRHPFKQPIDTDVVDSIVIFEMDPGSGAGMTVILLGKAVGRSPLSRG